MEQQHAAQHEPTGGPAHPHGLKKKKKKRQRENKTVSGRGSVEVCDAPHRPRVTDVADYSRIRMTKARRHLGDSGRSCARTSCRPEMKTVPTR